jgi:FMN-dependent NADH-azoreductase
LQAHSFKGLHHAGDKWLLLVLLPANKPKVVEPEAFRRTEETKHYIDILTMPKTYFDMNLKDGSYLPCLKPGKRATTVHSAAVYYPGVNDRYGVDHLSNSLSDWLKLGGITDVQSVWYHYNRFMSQEKAEHNFEVASSFAREAAKR